MNHCTRCGTANAPTNRACIACGTPMHAAAAQPPGGPAPYAQPPGYGGPGGPPTGPPSPAFGTPPPAFDAPSPAFGNPPPAYGAPPPGAPVPGAYAPPPAGYGPPTAGTQEARPSRPAIGGDAGEGAVTSPTTASPMAGGSGKICGFLVSFETNERGESWVIRAGTTKVGRKGAADGLTVEIEHPTVSSNHCVIQIDPAKNLTQIEDTQSANGTMLNGHSIAGQGRRELRDGDALRFGGYNLLLKLI